ncbi:MAG: DUF975 family protein [Calditrichaeota bacterium]|nr:MAG: DUF975 family protein [Calditrichota bacterium]
MNPKISAIECLKEGWECFKVRYWQNVGIYILLFVSMMIIPISLEYLFRYFGISIQDNGFSWISNFIIMPIFIGNLIYVTLKIARKKFGSFRLFNFNFKFMIKIVYAFVILYLILMSSFPISIGIVYLALYTQKIPFFVTVIVAIVSASISMYFVLRTQFVYYILADDSEISVINAIKKSFRITRGHILSYLRLFGLLALATWAGIILFIIPGIIAYIVGWIALSRFYLKLIDIDNANQESEQPQKIPVIPL